jgi:hypothetical protein
VVKKIKGEYYLTRSEAIDYLRIVYGAVWCMTKWESTGVRVSYQLSSNLKGNHKFNAYKCEKTSNVRLRKTDLDIYFRGRVDS